MRQTLIIESGRENEFLALASLPGQRLVQLSERIGHFNEAGKSDSLPDLMEEDGKLASILVGIYQAYLNLDEGLEKFMERLFNTFQLLGGDIKETAPEFANKFSPLFDESNPVLQWVNIQLNVESIHPDFRDVKVFTEVRPIMRFGNQVQIAEHKIFNYLRFSFDEGGGDVTEQFVTVDMESLQMIKKEIDRAIRQNELLNTTFKKIG